MNITSTITTLDVAGTKVVFHVAQEGGKASYKVEHDNDDVTVYLYGTVDEMADFAAQITRAISVQAIREVEAAERGDTTTGAGAIWSRIDGTARWCFVCRDWVSEWQTHAHAHRSDIWHPRNTAELAQRDRATFAPEGVTP